MWLSTERCGPILSAIRSIDSDGGIDSGVLLRIITTEVEKVLRETAMGVVERQLRAQIETAPWEDTSAARRLTAALRRQPTPAEQALAEQGFTYEEARDIIAQVSAVLTDEEIHTYIHIIAEASAVLTDEEVRDVITQMSQGLTFEQARNVTLLVSQIATSRQLRRAQAWDVIASQLTHEQDHEAIALASGGLPHLEAHDVVALTSLGHTYDDAYAMIFEPQASRE